MWGEAEEFWIEAANIIEETAAPGVDLSFFTWFRIEETVEWPAIGRNIGDRVSRGLQKFPKVIR